MISTYATSDGHDDAHHVRIPHAKRERLLRYAPVVIYWSNERCSPSSSGGWLSRAHCTAIAYAKTAAAEEKSSAMTVGARSEGIKEWQRDGRRVRDLEGHVTVHGRHFLWRVVLQWRLCAADH